MQILLISKYLDILTFPLDWIKQMRWIYILFHDQLAYSSFNKIFNEFLYLAHEYACTHDVSHMWNADFIKRSLIKI